MTTAVDFDALEGATAPRVILVGNQRVADGGTGGAFSGFSVVSSLYVSASVQLTARPRGAPGLTLLVEHSDDGLSWSTAETFSFGNDGEQDATLASPKDYIRASWTVAGSSEWYLRSVTVAPLASLGSGGGSQPGAAYVVGPYTVAFSDVPGDGDVAAVLTMPTGAVLLTWWVDPDTFVGFGSAYAVSIGQGAGFASGDQSCQLGFLDLNQNAADGEANSAAGNSGRNALNGDTSLSALWVPQSNGLIVKARNSSSGTLTVGSADIYFLLSVPVAP